MTPRQKKIAVVFLLGMTSVNGFMLWHAQREMAEGYGDFASFYTAGKIVQRGQAPRLYDRRVQWQVQKEFAPDVRTRRGPLPYIRPPFEALLFLPFVYLKFSLAHLLWSILNLLGLVAFFVLLPRDPLRTKRTYPMDLLICAAFFPVVCNFVAGQDAVLLLLVMVVALRCLLAGKDFRAGLVLGLGLFKFNFLIPVFLVFLLRRKFGVVSGLALTASVLLVISVVMVGPAVLLAYPHYLWDLGRAVGVGVITAETMPNIRGLLVPLLGSGAIAKWLHVCLGIVVIAGAATTAYIWGSDDGSIAPRATAGGFSLLIVVTLVTSYYANSYDLTLLLLPIFLLLRKFLSSDEIRGWPRTLFLGCIVVLLCSSLWWVVALRFNQFFWMGWVLAFFAIALGQTVRIWRRSEFAP